MLKIFRIRREYLRVSRTKFLEFDSDFFVTSTSFKSTFLCHKVSMGEQIILPPANCCTLTIFSDVTSRVKGSEAEPVVISQISTCIYLESLNVIFALKNKLY